MKNVSTVAFAVLLALAITSQGFQCSSPEFSGAKLRYQQKDYKGAIALLETEVQKNPANEDAWYLLGESRWRMEDYVGMNDAFAHALKLSNKDDARMRTIRFGSWGQHVNNAVSYLERASSDSAQLYEMAVKQFKLAIDIWPDTSLTYKYLAIAYNNRGDLDNALVNFKVAWEKGKDLESLKRVGRIYFVKGTELDNKFESDNTDKIRIAKNLVDIKKGSHKNDVMAAFGAPDNVKKATPAKKGKMTTGARSDAKEQWTYNAYNLVLDIQDEKVVDKRFTKPYEPNIDSTFHRQALIYYDSAATAFETVKGVDPKDSENLNMLLQAYVKSGNIKEAIATFRTAITNDPNNKVNHYILGILLRTDGEYQPAIDEFKTALTMDPNYSDATYDIGATLYNWGVDILKQADAKNVEDNSYKQKFQEAVPYLEKVSESKKDDPMVFETIGTIYARLGQGEKARKVFEEADWLRKHFGIKLGMKQDDVISMFGQPTGKEETTVGTEKGTKLVYDKESVTFVVVNGVVKDWTHTVK